MRLLKKILIVSAVLLAPILAFLFLKQFGYNKFELPIFYENGHPLPECRNDTLPHHISSSFIAENKIHLPALFEVATELVNKFDSDLLNVLDKYPEVRHYGLSSDTVQTHLNLIKLDSLSFFQAVNCELIFGEDHFISRAIEHKFVLVGTNGIIRGYFIVNDLEEIERLDIELDILLNYDDEN